MKNGRCRMHGGTSPGAPKGNKNALKHGQYSADAIARRRSIADEQRWRGFARDLMVQEVGHAKLRAWHWPDRGGQPRIIHRRHSTAKLVRQIRAISEFDKAMTVAKLRGARERRRREVGKCEGRKSHAERNPELVVLAKRLHRRKPKGGCMSLRAISAVSIDRGLVQRAMSLVSKPNEQG
jgi:hypothetical protein